MTRIQSTLVRATAIALGLGAAAAAAADRQIGINPTLSVTWYTLTGGTTTPAPAMQRNMSAGFWQRSSGAKAGVGSINTGVVEFQLPENPPQRVRSATLLFKARATQCAGAEPVVLEAFGYAGNGQAEANDAISGVRVGQLRADCKDNPAFASQAIDVTSLVRQLTVPSGLRFVGFNVRKMNHRAGPSLFGFSSAVLTIVVADQDLPIGATSGESGSGAAVAGAAAPPAGGASDPASLLRGLVGAAATVIAGGGSSASQQQGREQAAAALRDSATTASAAVPAEGSNAATASGGAAAGGVPPVAAAGPVAAAPMVGGGAPAVGGAVNVDIVGLRLGMSIDEVRRALQAHSPTLRLDETRGIVNNVAATEYLSWVIARLPKGAPAGSADAIGVHFPPPPNAHRAIFIERFTGFQNNQFPLWDTLKAALVQKFGAPSQESEGVMLWTYNASGVQIVDDGVARRCAKFAPTDPPARGQNVLFNGYKTAGCGVTVYVRYERGRGPSDRDLVRWMSVSLVDDSRFEDLRQAAAQFATQATRAGASKVAAPKL